MFDRESQINLRHLRGFIEVCSVGTVTEAAGRVFLSQPALSQAIANLECQTGQKLFHRKARQLVVTRAGEMLLPRAHRVLGHLANVDDLFPRKAFQPSNAQLRAFCALCASHSFTAAARRLGLAQPTVHRATKTLEQEATAPLIERRRSGVFPTSGGELLNRAALLAFSELRQALEELEHLSNRTVGKIQIGSTPLARTALLPVAIEKFSRRFPGFCIRISEGAYTDQLAALRDGQLDFLVGALRPADQSEDLFQTELFIDKIVAVCAPAHPALLESDPKKLARFPWAIAQAGTPSRRVFEQVFGQPASMELVETSSSILLERLLRRGRHLGFISAAQVSDQVAEGHLMRLPLNIPDVDRPIGITCRKDWFPTHAQKQFLALLREIR